MNNGDLWWSSRSSDTLFDATALIDYWEKDLIALSRRQNPSADREQSLQSLADLTKSLWQTFNTNRAALDRDYMSTERNLSAYLSAFFISNIERSRYILTRTSLLKILAELEKKENISILDFGAGPLSSTFGFLIALGEVLGLLSDGARDIRRITIVAVERSEKAVRLAQNWLTRCIHPSVQIEVERRTSIPTDKSFDVVLASNVFNEIDEKHHLKTFRMLQNCLGAKDAKASAILLIVEPGQELHSKRLVSLRDQVLHDARELQLVAPCPHSSACPLGPQLSRPDWCWFRRTFRAPPFQLELDQRTRIDHQELAFSYLAFAQHKPMQNNKPWAICVSDPIPMGDPDGQRKRQIYLQSNRLSESAETSEDRIAHLSIHGAKTKLCSQSGALLAGINEAVSTPRRHRRGDEVFNSKEFELLIQER